MKKTALITGITSQDGAYLAQFLLEKGYEVHGIKRRASLLNTERVDHLYQDPHMENRKFILHYGDLTDATNLIRILQQVQPDEVYNLAAQSHVQVSFESPEYTADTDALGTLRMLEGIRLLGMENKTRFYQASTSELYGKVQEVPQTETTPFYPRSPYAAAALGVEILWQGSGKEEKGIVAGVKGPDTPLKKRQQIVAVDPRYFRPTEVETLLGDPTKARTKLGWVPRISFDIIGARSDPGKCKGGLRYVWLLGGKVSGS
jgi:GDP-D-mannose dehydratase